MAMDRAEKARNELIKSLSDPIDVTPEKAAGDHGVAAAQAPQSRRERGNSELMVMRFPNCPVHGQGPGHQQRGRGLARNPDRPAPPGLRVLARSPAARRLRPQGHDRRMARRHAGRRRLLPQLGRRPRVNPFQDHGTATMPTSPEARARPARENPVPSALQAKFAEVYQGRCATAVQDYLEATRQGQPARGLMRPGRSPRLEALA